MSDPLASITLSYAAYAEVPADGQRWKFLDGEVFVTPHFLPHTSSRFSGCSALWKTT
jgi:hypothetical protein